MGDEIEYEVVLCPEGTTPDTAIDTRQFTYATTETDENVLRTEVLDHIMAKRIDPDVFRSHWTLFEIRPAKNDETNDSSATATPLDTFKNQLPVGRSPPFTPSGPHRVRSLNIFILHRGIWSQRTLFPSSQTHQAFTNWLAQSHQTHSGIVSTSVQDRDLHEAAVRTVAAVNPSFATSFDATKEKHHTKALQLVGDNESEFLAQLKSLQTNSWP